MAQFEGTQQESENNPEKPGETAETFDSRTPPLLSTGIESESRIPDAEYGEL